MPQRRCSTSLRRNSLVRPPAFTGCNLSRRTRSSMFCREQPSSSQASAVVMTRFATNDAKSSALSGTGVPDSKRSFFESSRVVPQQTPYPPAWTWTVSNSEGSRNCGSNGTTSQINGRVSASCTAPPEKNTRGWYCGSGTTSSTRWAIRSRISAGNSVSFRSVK